MKTTDLAKDIIFLCLKYGVEFNNTKVQKLVYLFIGFSLMNDIEEIKYIDELPKAWQYGPVFPEVYKHYNSLVKDVNTSYKLSVVDTKAKDILEKTVKVWGRINAGTLSEWSHKNNSPWDVVINNEEEYKNGIIPLEMIYNYFSENVENVLDEAEESALSRFIKKIFS